MVELLPSSCTKQ